MGQDVPAPATEGLAKFTPRVVPIGRAFCAIDYAMSNCTAVQVKGGYVLIDTGPNPEIAAEIRAALEKHVQGKLLGIIYTHAHTDHFFGASAFWRPGVPIWATERFLEEIREQRKLAQAGFDRGARQFGLRLPPDQATTGSIGPRLQGHSGPVPPLLLPTHTFRDSLEFEVGGVRFELRAAPGKRTTTCSSGCRKNARCSRATTCTRRSRTSRRFAAAARGRWNRGCAHWTRCGISPRPRRT